MSSIKSDHAVCARTVQVRFTLWSQDTRVRYDGPGFKEGSLVTSKYVSCSEEERKTIDSLSLQDGCCACRCLL
jgi:hypothetical protein